MQKAAYMRESVNTVFQGSAADLIKLAMNAIDAAIVEEKLDATMLLQIHDELIFEIAEDKAEETAQRFKTMMENVYTLEVPLRCSVSVGESWGALK
jgi:DNA polymerase-1